MIPKECKRLAEVDFPIAVVSRHSAKEKSIRHGHPSALHLWWARRPLAACRAMLMGLLLPDPSDSNCPNDFKQRARNILPRAQGHPGAKDIDLRNELLRFIGQFADWENSSNPVFLEVARSLVRAAHAEGPPLVVDPFSGGGSIPLEALRLGCEAYATDLNPVACRILKTLLVDAPRYGPALADQLQKVGAKIREHAASELAEFYPTDADGSKPMAYIWARTIICDSCGSEIPLMRSFWLSNKAKRKRALRFKLVRPRGESQSVEFSICTPSRDADVPPGTVSQAKATCLSCGTVLSPQRVRAQLVPQRGGSDVIFDGDGRRIGGARLMAVAMLRDGDQQRHYRVATEQDYRAVYKATKVLASVAADPLPSGLSAVPDEKTPQDGTGGVGGGFRTRKYGFHCFADFYTARQKLMLIILARAISRDADAPSEIVDALALSLGKVLRHCNVISKWHRGSETVAGAFGMQAIPMSWDFPELFPLVRYAGSLSDALEDAVESIETAAMAAAVIGQSNMADAAEHPLPDESAQVWFTDPPYYDSVPYADLSDFFFVWLKRIGRSDTDLRDPFDASNPLTPKIREAVRDEQNHIDGRPKKSAEWYEQRMHRAFSEGRRILVPNGIGSVVFAHKTTEGWEALLSGIIRGGWTISASWPLNTERGARLRARESAALATSVHLVCRPRPEDAPVGDWAEVLRDLPRRVGDWIEKLQSEGVRGADLVFACIGPAMEIYSRYRHVEDAEGRVIPLGGDPTASEPCKRGFLAYVWETVGRLALEQVLGTAEAKARNGAAGALEEDSRLTALFLWTLQTTETASNDTSADAEDEADDDDDAEEEKPKKKKAGFSLIYDVARRFAQPLGIHLDKWEGRIIETEKGVIRLLPVAERAQQLFGDADAVAISRRIEDDVKASRNYSFAFMQDAGVAPAIKPRGRGRKTSSASGVAAAEAPAPQQVTTLDRVHAAMLLQASGQTNGLRAMLREEQQRGPDFIRLANALSALYPKDSEEKRLLDAMLLAIPRN